MEPFFKSKSKKNKKGYATLCNFRYTAKQHSTGLKTFRAMTQNRELRNKALSPHPMVF